MRGSFSMKLFSDQPKLFNTLEPIMNLISSSQNKRYFFVFAICFLCFTTVLLPKDTFLFLVQEDGPFESAGAMLFLASAILFFILFFRSRSFSNEADASYYDSKSKRTWFLLLGLLFFFFDGRRN